VAKCLILGANGFIGSHLTDALVEDGNAVRAFGRFRNGELRFNSNSNIEIFEGDFLNRDDISRAVDGMDYVFHFISSTTPATAENDPMIDIDTNVKMSIILFEECVQKKVKKVIFASTGGAIYGGYSGEPMPETIPPQPVSPYAIGKLTIEHYLRYFNKKFGLDSLVYRISNPYGERHVLNSKQGVINIFLEQIAKSQPITILGDGGMVRDYIYVSDIANMITGSFKDAKQDLYNLGSGHGLSVNNLVENIGKIVERPIEKNYLPAPSTFVNKVVLNTDRFQEEFSIRPSVDIEEGIRRTWEYITKSIDL
jgi:UDP-glucose 4-epimerase